MKLSSDRIGKLIYALYFHLLVESIEYCSTVNYCIYLKYGLIHFLLIGLHGWICGPVEQIMRQGYLLSPTGTFYRTKG